jgi:translation initiation factor eIF-2B subunit beta
MLTFGFVWLFGSKIEGSQATARQAAELLRSVISQQRVPYTNQAGALIDAVRAVGEQLIAANPVGKHFIYFNK